MDSTPASWAGRTPAPEADRRCYRESAESFAIPWALGRFTRVGEAGVAVRSVKYEDVCLRAYCLGFWVHCSAFQ